MAFDEYFTTVAEYNRAQFELFHALGYPAREIAYFRPPGEVQPVDTTRPTSCPRWAMGRPRQPDERPQSADHARVCRSSGVGFEMTERSAWPFMLIVAAARLGRLRRCRAAAQPPTVAT